MSLVRGMWIGYDLFERDGMCNMALGQNLVALVNIKIACKWVFTPLTLTIIGFDTHTPILSHTYVIGCNWMDLSLGQFVDKR